jgi:hypothetical protein
MVLEVALACEARACLRTDWVPSFLACREGGWCAASGVSRKRFGNCVERLRTTQGFLRAIGEARLITPLRSEGGHRRYSRYQLRIAARARELVDQGFPIEAACRIVILEDQLEEAQRINAEYRRAAESANPTTAT